MKQPDVDLGQGHARERGVDGQIEFIPSRRRRVASAKACRLQAISIADTSQAERKCDDSRVRGAAQHGGAIEGKDADAFKGNNGTKIKQIDRQVVCTAGLRIIPQRQFRVITYPIGMRRLKHKNPRSRLSRWDRLSGTHRFIHRKARQYWEKRSQLLPSGQLVDRRTQKGRPGSGCCRKDWCRAVAKRMN